jgi:Tol biopolymer transport system component
MDSGGNLVKPLWLPDSAHVVFRGLRTGQPPSEYWWVPLSGGELRQLNWSRWGVEHGLSGRPDVWPSREALIGSLNKDGNTQIYEVPVSSLAAGFQLGEPELLTSGAALSLNATVAAGRMAFRSGTVTGAIWSLPADTNTGHVTGPLEKLNNLKVRDGWVTATPDGKTIAFSSNRTSRYDIFVRDMASGQERAIAAEESDLGKVSTRINAAGTEIIYATQAGPSDAYVVPAQGGSRRKICEGCGPTESLSPDGTAFLATRNGPRGGVNLVDIASGKSTLILEHTKFRTAWPRFSPDGKWITFGMLHSGNTGDVMIAPFRGATSIPEQDWITLTEGPENLYQQFWSPDGGLVYYEFRRGSSNLLMARRLDRSGRPVGVSFRVFEFPGRLYPLSNLIDGMIAVPGRFITAITEQSSNIWMMDLPK